MSMEKGFWAKGLQSLKEIEHIGSLIHDFTVFDKIIFQKGRQFIDKKCKTRHLNWTFP
jgi:hypothetical protein